MNENNINMVYANEIEHPNTPLSNELLNSYFASPHKKEKNQDVNINDFKPIFSYKDENNENNENNKNNENNEINNSVKSLILNTKIGNGKMEYIKDDYTRYLYINAWNAITLSNNWEYVHDNNDNFMFSKNKKLNDILNKMEELGFKGHSGLSFGCVMKNMQFLVRNGENNFMNLFVY